VEARDVKANRPKTAVGEDRRPAAARRDWGVVEISAGEITIAGAAGRNIVDQARSQDTGIPGGREHVGNGRLGGSGRNDVGNGGGRGVYGHRAGAAETRANGVCRRQDIGTAIGYLKVVERQSAGIRPNDVGAIFLPLQAGGAAETCGEDELAANDVRGGAGSKPEPDPWPAGRQPEFRNNLTSHFLRWGTS